MVVAGVRHFAGVEEDVLDACVVGQDYQYYSIGEPRVHRCIGRGVRGVL